MNSAIANPATGEAVSSVAPPWHRTIPLVAGGSMLEFYEFQTFAMFAVIIGDTFFSPGQPEWVRQLQTFSILSVGFFFRPISGAVIGVIGDRMGRKASFLITILLMALPTLGIGLLPGYAAIGLAAPIALLVLRIAQGVASAGEMAGAAVFVTEAAPTGRKGFASGLLYGAIHFGYFFAALVAAAINFAMPQEQVRAYGWRIAFVLGGVMGLLTLVARRRLQESPAFEQIKAAHGQARAPLTGILKRYRGQLVTVALLGGFVGVTIALVYTYGPTYLQTAAKVPAKTMNGVVAAAFLVLALSAAVWGRLADRIGFGRVIALGGGLVLLISGGFCADFRQAVASPGLLLAWYLVMSVALGSVGCVFALASSLFPADIRLTGLGIAYNLGLALFLGTAPFALAFLTHAYGGGMIVAYIWAAVTLGLIAVFRARKHHRSL